MDFYSYGLFGLFLVCFIASSLYPLGSEVFVIGFLIAGFDIFTVFIIASLGNILGSLSTYYIAYFGGEYAIKKIFKDSYNKMKKYEKYTQKYGVICAFFSFLPFIGDILVLLLGLYRYNQFYTWLFISFGKMVRYFILIYAYVLGFS